MTVRAAILLDDAWDLYYKIASHEDQKICTQTPSRFLLATPYDYAAALCKSLIPLTYNFDRAQHPGLTDKIWDLMIARMEIVDTKHVHELLNDVIER